MEEKGVEKENLENNKETQQNNIEKKEPETDNIEKKEPETEKEDITDKKEVSKEKIEKEELHMENTNNNEDNSKENISENIEDKKISNLYVESTEPFMQVVTKELIECLNDENNRNCFDCQSTPANWVCVNNGIFLCSKCAGEHRGYGAIISNLKFIMLDKLNEFQIELMKRGG